MLNFAAIPAAYRQVAKELCDCLLSADLPLGESRRQISSIRSMFSEFRRFLLLLDDRHRATGRVATLTAVTATDLGEYARNLLTAVPSAERRRFCFSCTRYFWRYRQVLTTDRLVLDPQGVQGWTVPQDRRQENRTDRIPEQVLGPLVGWSMRFVTYFAGDILAADRAWTARRANTGAGQKCPPLMPRTR